MPNDKVTILINASCVDGPIFDVQVDGADSIGHVKEMARARLVECMVGRSLGWHRARNGRFVLQFEGVNMLDRWTISDNGIGQGSELLLHVVPRGGLDLMVLVPLSEWGCNLRRTPMEVHPDDVVEVLVLMLEEMERERRIILPPIYNLVLIRGIRVLALQRSFRAQGVQPGDMIIVFCDHFKHNRPNGD
ncbi:hypothetical protein HPP92_001518 [Vanilla planifolia]|uniref:Ubiquitin-like domain-containing protein n=1 Tax=Vanilla planifolia TaxID=51239 RepID=A0A835S3I0_VANPL|nr:hypothetical protein HPP92_001518 [Vanilla planifolia]